MKHYHGTPLGGTRESVARFVTAARRFFLVPFLRQEDLPIIAESSAGFMLDNSAFTAWKSGNPITDWGPYYSWVEEWCFNPRFDFCIIPDVIDGTERDNLELIGRFEVRMRKDGILFRHAAPVWHLHESLSFLTYLLNHFDIICFGSSGQYATPGEEAWHARMREAFDLVCDKQGRPRKRIHGLRMLSPDIVEQYPFYSCDSTNVAQNSQLLERFGMYKPPSQAQRREVIASRIESAVSPSVFVRNLKQMELFSEQ